MALREILAEFGFKTDQGALDQADKTISGMVNKVKNGAAAFAAFFAVGAIRSFVTETTEAADAVAKMADALGLGIVELQEWHYFAGLAGVETQAVNVAITKLGQKISQASNGNAEMSKTFKMLNVDAKELEKIVSEKGLGGAFEHVGLALAGIADDAKRTDIALKLFEESGAKLFNIFKGGPASLQAMREELQELGVYTDEFARDAENVDDALAKMGLSFRGIKISILGTFLPWIQQGASGLAKFVGATRKWIESTNLGKAALITLGGALAVFARASIVAGVRALAPWLPWILLFTGIIALVDELITTWTGGDSLIRRVIDGRFGPGTTAKIVDTIKKWIGVVEDFFATFDVKDFIKWIIDQLNAVAFSIDDKVNGAIDSLVSWLDKLAPAISGVAAMIATVWLKANGMFLLGMLKSSASVSAFTLQSIPAMIAALVRQGAAMTAVAVKGAAQYVLGFARMAAAQVAMLATNPCTWIVIGIGLAVAALVWLVQNWDQVVADFGYALADLGKWFEELWDGVVSYASGAWSSLVSMISGYVDQILGFIRKIPGADSILSGIKTILDPAGLSTSGPKPRLDSGAAGNSSTSSTVVNNTAAPVINVDARGATNPGAVRQAVRGAAGAVQAATTRGFEAALVPKEA